MPSYRQHLAAQYVASQIARLERGEDDRDQRWRTAMMTTYLAAQDHHVRDEERRRIMTGDWLTESVADFVERLTAAVTRS